MKKEYMQPYLPQHAAVHAPIFVLASQVLQRTNGARTPSEQSQPGAEQAN